MPRRWAVFVVALVLGGAPSMVLLCELRCGAHASTARENADAGSTHACHDSAPARATLTACGVHVCGHGDTLVQAATGTLETPSVPTLAILQTPAALLRDGRIRHPRLVQGDASPPDPPITSQQLRI